MAVLAPSQGKRSERAGRVPKLLNGVMKLVLVLALLLLFRPR